MKTNEKCTREMIMSIEYAYRFASFLWNPYLSRNIINSFRKNICLLNFSQVIDSSGKNECKLNVAEENNRF